jgi:hypothetical protein
MGIELSTCNDCGRKNALTRQTCLSCGATLRLLPYKETGEVASSAESATWIKQHTPHWNPIRFMQEMTQLSVPSTQLKTNWRRGLNRVYAVVCAIWFAAWLFGFPLYVRNQDLNDATFFADSIVTSQTAWEKLSPQEQDRLKLILERLITPENANSPLTLEFERKSKDINEWFIKATGTLFSVQSEWAKQSLEDLQKIKKESESRLFREFFLRAVREDASLTNVYQRLMKSHWRGWTPYIFLVPLILYVLIQASVLTARWIAQGFQRTQQ